MNKGKEKRNFIIVGGGLAGSLTLHALRHYFPQKNILLIEKSERICSPHTWSFHDSDIPASQRNWLVPLITHSWSEYQVYFPQYQRTLNTSYHSIRSQDLEQKTLAAQSTQIEILLQTEISQLAMDKVTIRSSTGDIEILEADLVIDARGWAPLQGRQGYQKFLGCEVELESPHHLTSPILKDARLEQSNAYHFMYVLPWDEKHLLIEDTYYANTPELSIETYEKRIRTYAQEQGWKINRILSQEQGSLPLALQSQNYDFSTVCIGARSGFYQPVTGYSLPQSLQTLEWLIPHLQKDFSSSKLVDLQIQWLQKQNWRQNFYLFLNRMLFLSAEPSKRYRILERFYKLSPELIHRFYAGQSTPLDFARILVGRPPVPLHRVVRAL